MHPSSGCSASLVRRRASHSLPRREVADLLRESLLIVEVHALADFHVLRQGFQPLVDRHCFLSCYAGLTYPARGATSSSAPPSAEVRATCAAEAGRTSSIALQMRDAPLVRRGVGSRLCSEPFFIVHLHTLGHFHALRQGFHAFVDRHRRLLTAMPGLRTRLVELPLTTVRHALIVHRCSPEGRGRQKCA